MKMRFRVNKKALLSPPIIALIIANMIPIGGVLWYGWDTFVIVSLFWTETVIIGFFALLRIISAPVQRISSYKKLGGICFILFFLGGACSAFGFAIIFMFFVYPQWAPGAVPFPVPPTVPEDIYQPSWPGPLSAYKVGIDTARLLYYLLPSKVMIAIYSLVLSHGVSFVWDYLVKGKKRLADLKKLIEEPLTRVLVLYGGISVGFFSIVVFKTNVAGLIGLLLLKCWVDTGMYMRRQRKKDAGMLVIDKNEM